MTMICQSFFPVNMMFHEEGGIDKGELLIADFIFHSMSVFGIFTQLEATFFKWPMHIDNNYA